MALVCFLSFCVSSDYYDVFQFTNESKFQEPSVRLGEGLENLPLARRFLYVSVKGYIFQNHSFVLKVGLDFNCNGVKLCEVF